MSESNASDERREPVELTDEQRRTVEEANAQDPDQVSNDELESQTWTLGETRSGIRTERGMKWKLTEPDDDAVVADLIQSLAVGPANPDTWRKWVQAYVESPTVTDELWEEQTVAMDRFALFDMVFEFSEFADDDEMAAELARVREEELPDADDADESGLSE